jgi:hypothetical protein
MSSHLWILSKLIFPEKSQLDTPILNTLLKYTITTCHKKMNRRFNHDLSMRHFESLRNVKDFPFNLNPELQVDTDLDKISNDRAFVSGFVARTLRTPEMLTSLIPNIQLLCNNLPRESEPFQLYTSETCMEFHNLLVELLDKFKLSCSSLSSLAKTRVELLKPLPQNKSSLSPHAKNNEKLAENHEKFKNDVSQTVVLGHTLLRIARGSAFEMHLQNIATLLEDHRNTEIPMPMPNPAVEQEEAEVENEDKEFDKELDEVIDEELLPILSSITDLGHPVPLWNTYRDWMRLMVVHFDAAKILTTYAASQNSLPNRTISFKILVTPRVDHAFLPWSELLTDSRLFPAADASGKYTSNEEILHFLDNGLASVKAANTNEQHGQLIMKLWADSESTKGRKQILKTLALLKDSPAYTVSVNEIVGLLERWRGDQANSTLKKEISDKISSLKGRLTADKNSVDFPTDLELQRFIGTLHCEKCLSSILHKGTRNTMVSDEYKDLLKQTEVNYHYSDLSML